MIANNLTPAYPTHPGEVVKDEIEYRGISQRKLAEQMGISYKMLNDILNGRRPMTTATAMLLEAAEMLGASKLYAFFRVIVPNIISGITVSSLLAVGIIFGDYVLIRNIAGTSFKNVQIYLFLTMKSSSTKASAVFVIIMITTFLITLLVLYLKSRETKHRNQKVKG